MVKCDNVTALLVTESDGYALQDLVFATAEFDCCFLSAKHGLSEMRAAASSPVVAPSWA